MLNLYQIADEYLHVFHNLEHVPDEEIEAKLDDLNKLFTNFEDTAVAMAAYIKNLEAEEDVIRQTIDTYDKRAETLERRTNKYKQFLKTMMDKLAIQKIIKHPLHKLRIKNNPPAVVIKDLNMVPESEYKTKTMVYLDKLALREKLLNGDQIPGCVLEQQTRLEIK